MNAPLIRKVVQRNDVLRQAMIDAGVIRPAQQPYLVTTFRNHAGTVVVRLDELALKAMARSAEARRKYAARERGEWL